MSEASVVGGEDMFEQRFIHILVDQETEKGGLLASSFLP